MPVTDIVDEAAWLTEAERSEGVRRVQASLAEPGADDCVGCGEPIEPARRAALPSARRCTGCQERVERRENTKARAPVVGDGLNMTMRGTGL
jgi:phage/conjugal plasmid C-4 type zinc finger TraR family protein